MQGKIKYIIIDVDGTLTDGKIYIGPDGEVFKQFNVKDGYAISNLLPPSGIIPIVVTGRSSRIVQNRCKELGIDQIYQGVTNKLQFIQTKIEDLSSVAYIGDDLNDLWCMKIIKRSGGMVGCPHDAVCPVKDIADYISQYDGGAGAVREFIEWIFGKEHLIISGT